MLSFHIKVWQLPGDHTRGGGRVQFVNIPSTPGGNNANLEIQANTDYGEVKLKSKVPAKQPLRRQ